MIIPRCDIDGVKSSDRNGLMMMFKAGGDEGLSFPYFSFAPKMYCSTPYWLRVK